MYNTKIGLIRPEELAIKMEEPSGSLVIVDCRSNIEYATWHICGAVNIGGSRNTRREILCGKKTVRSLLLDKIDRSNQEYFVVVYDQCSLESGSLQSLAGRVADDLTLCSSSVSFLRGGFIDFQSKFTNLCWTSSSKEPYEDFMVPSHCEVSGQEKIADSGTVLSLTRSQTVTTLNSNQRGVARPCTSGLPMYPSVSRFASALVRRSLSGPALSKDKEGPTTVLPYLFLGTQQDALSQSSMQGHAITHVINVSTEGAICPFVSPHNFLRVPVLDNFADKITPYFSKAFAFLDDVKATGGRALVHCSAGISRSPTLAIGYLMRTMLISVMEAYNIVKRSRTSVSPNFNFMGQLTDYEKSLAREMQERPPPCSVSTAASVSRVARRKRPSRLAFLTTLPTPLLTSPSVPFARLEIESPMEEGPGMLLQARQTGPLRTKVKRSAAEGEVGCSRTRKRLSVMEPGPDGLQMSSSVTEAPGSRRHSSFLPPSTDSSSEPPQASRLSSRSVSHERASDPAWGSSSLATDSCRLQESQHSTSSLSSATSHSSNLLA